jgi:hypothetical protein
MPAVNWTSVAIEPARLDVGLYCANDIASGPIGPMAVISVLIDPRRR